MSIYERAASLVTGGAGFLRSHLCGGLLERGDEVNGIRSCCDEGKRCAETLPNSLEPARLALHGAPA
jgi:nucleoside-diphosphate-sugar epimerase